MVTAFKSEWCFSVFLTCILSAPVLAIDTPPSRGWLDQVTATRPASTQPSSDIYLKVVRHDHEKMRLGRSVIDTPLTIGGRTFDQGVGTHATSHLQIISPVPLVRVDGWIGVDENERTRGGKGSVIFRLTTPRSELHRSPLMHEGDPPQRVDYDLRGVKVLDLYVEDGGDGTTADHADWANFAVTTHRGRVYLDEMALESEKPTRTRFPFSFLYGGKPSDDLLEEWKHQTNTEKLDDVRFQTIQHWTDPESGLRVTHETIDYIDFPARDWIVYLENKGEADSEIFQQVRALDATFRSPLKGVQAYRLHKMHGGTPDELQFEPNVVAVDSRNPQSLDAGQGRSSAKDFPFFKIEAARGSAIVAIGWSGMWEANLASPDDRQLHLTAGQQDTHFLLHPGEKVRLPRILMMCWEGDTLESNAQFRQLIYKHYTPERSAKPVLPTLFCNTAFTRNGTWLNECNADNQISLINTYGPLRLDLMITDAGWFDGGWPSGVGNWAPRKNAYPEGMKPVAAAAKNNGMIYGLWFEPERVGKDTDLYKKHPEWLLGVERESTMFLANFGLPEVQEYFFNIVKGFMELPGFRVYRQDFNMDPLPYWRLTDKPDRKGITEMKYIEGLYTYWDRIAEAWPDSWREECASGGNRIDLETIKRMHVHQKSDYWFDDDVDQASLWGYSQYLPNNTVAAHLVRFDDYSFHSTLASSLCVGWIADAPEFNVQEAKTLTDRYRALRHLLVGAWYPLLPYSRDKTQWIGSQYHRADLDEGMLLVFRRAESPYRSIDVALRGLNPDETYELSFDSTGAKATMKGEELMKSLTLTLPEKPRSDVIVYRKISTTTTTKSAK